MLFIRVSSNRVFFVDEYWILIPLVLALDIAIIIKVKKARAKKKLESEQLKQKSKRWKIFHIATGNFTAALESRGGQDIMAQVVENYIEVIHPNCLVGEGLRYVNNERLRKLVHSLFKSKAKNGVIYITKTALCHLVEIYGLALPALPIPIPDFIGISSWLVLGRKLISSACLGIPLPMLILAQGPASVIVSLAAAGLGIIIMYHVQDPGFTIIPTDAISTPVSLINRRVPDQPELVSVDLTSVGRKKIIMPEFSTSYECSLPVQRMLNPKCILRTSKIVDFISNADVDVPLNYDQVVNMQDVTKLGSVQFSDQFEVTSSSKPVAHFNLRGSKPFRNRAKTSKFLQNFGDTENILDSEEWDVIRPTSNAQDAIKIRNTEL
jgi:hypothetical protein